MSTWTTLRDKIEHLFSSLFSSEAPIAEQVLVTTGEAVAAAALSGTVHGSEDMLNVAKASLVAQLPTVKPMAIAAAAAVITDHEAQAAATPAPTEAPAAGGQ